MTKIYYKKLCMNWSGQYKSVLGSTNDDIIYNFNNLVYPQYGKLFVFDTLKNADDFRYGTHIFECEIVGKPIAPKKIVDSEYISYIQKYWQLRKNKKGLQSIDKYLVDAPKGTLLVDGLRLIREIK